MKHFLEGKYFWRIVDDPEGGCSSQHGKILSVDQNFALIEFGSWEEGVPVNKPIERGKRLMPIVALCDEYCCLLDSFEEVIAAEGDTDIKEKDEFSSKWEEKMNQGNE